MEVASERVRRRAVLALILAMLLAAAPGVAGAADVTEVIPDSTAGDASDRAPGTAPDDAPDDDPTEQPTPDQEPPPDQPPPAQTTTLLLQPICTADGLQRFAVIHVSGPATEFTVRAAGMADGETLSIAVGETLHFWVDEAPATEIAWADGNASATPASEVCPQPAQADGLPPAPSSAPSGTAEPAPSERPSEVPEPVATPQPDTTATPPDGERSAQPAATPDAPAVPAQDDDADPQGAREAPRPSRSGPGGAYACPDGWVPVDEDADGRIESSDECEVLVATGAGGGPVRPPLTTAVLLVTIGLLVASIAVGALGSRRIALIPRVGPGRASSRGPRAR